MRDVRLAAAQVATVSGELDRNVATHAMAVEAAARQGVSLLVFPELSLTGYEPAKAREHALSPSDQRVSPLAERARQYAMTVVAGVPLLNRSDPPHLGAIVWEPDGNCMTYAKMHLGASERAWYTEGATPQLVRVRDETVGLAICADASAPSHPEFCVAAGASVYAAGVFLNAEWYATDAPRFPRYAKRLSLLVVMANHADSVGTYRSVGSSAAWGPDGALLAQAAGVDPCLVIAARADGAWGGEVVPL